MGAAALFLGAFFRLRLVVDPRLVVGGPIFGLVVDLGLAGDLDADDVDLDGFGGVLPVGWGFAVGFAIEADLEFMNPASVG